MFTAREFNNLIIDSASELKRVFGEDAPEEAAMDTARSLIYTPEIKDYLEKHLRTKNKRIMAEFLGEAIWEEYAEGY